MIHSATVKVIKDGRITIPSEIRELEDIKEEDYVKITIEKINRPKKEAEQKQPIKITHKDPNKKQDSESLISDTHN